jgi:hypothetical protein
MILAILVRNGGAWLWDLMGCCGLGRVLHQEGVEEDPHGGHEHPREKHEFDYDPWKDPWGPGEVVEVVEVVGEPEGLFAGKDDVPPLVEG